MATRSEWVTVTLAPAEVASAQAYARWQVDLAQRERLRPRGGADTRAAHLLGALGEYAVARYLGLPPVHGSHRDDHRRGYDVGGWSVRTRGQAHYGLLLYEHERRGTWVLVLGHEAPRGVLYLAGWIKAESAWNYATRRQDHGQPYYVVEQEHLIPLPNVIREAA